MNRQWVNALIYPLSDLLNLREEGILKLNVTTSALQEPLDKLTLGKTGKVFLVTPNGAPVLDQKPGELPAALLERLGTAVGEDDAGARIYRDEQSSTIYFYQRTETTGWIVVGAVSRKSFSRKSRELGRMSSRSRSSYS